MKKIWTLALILIISFLITINLPRISKFQFNSVSNAKTITLGYSNWPGWWLWEIAKSEKMFAQNNIKVELRWFDNYSESINALAGGYIDANCQTLNDTIAKVNQAIYGEVAVLVNDNSAGNDKIIVSKEIKNINDLKGKKIGLEQGVVDDFLLTLALEKSRINRNDLEIFNLETGVAAAIFAQGKLDAVGAFPPYWLQALTREGAHELISSADFPGAIVDLLVVSQKLIDENPEIVQGLVNTWFDVLKFVEQNPQIANQIIIDKVEISLEQLKLFQSGIKLFSLQDNLSAFTKGNDLKHLNFAAQKIQKFYESEQDAKQSDLTKLFDDRFISSYASSK